MSDFLYHYYSTKEMSCENKPTLTLKGFLKHQILITDTKNILDGTLLQNWRKSKKQNISNIYVLSTNI